MAKAKLITIDRPTSVSREQVREVVRKTAQLNKFAKDKLSEPDIAQIMKKKSK